MTKSAARRAIAGGCNARVFSQTAPTNLKSLNHKPRTSANHGAGPFIYRNTDVQRIADLQTDGFASRY
jgi:hypothetical protein